MDPIAIVNGVHEGCAVVSNNPDILKAFFGFMLDMTENGASDFLNAIKQIDPELVDKAKHVAYLCIGEPS